MNKSKLARAILVSLPLISMFSISKAAEVPSDIKLAAKQELVKGNGAEVVSLDPHKSAGVTEHNVLIDLFETLIITDPNGNLIPGAATHWESTDNQVWTFHLRKDAKWSNGDPVVAADFVYAWQRMVKADTESPYAGYFQFMLMENIDDILAGKKQPEELGVKAIDNHTLEIRLSSPVSYFPNMLTLYALPPLNKKVIDQFGADWTKPGNMVSNGAFQLEDQILNEKLVLKRNPHYWNNAKTVLDKVTFLPVVSATDESARYRAGEIDFTLQAPLDLIKKFKAEMPNELWTVPNLCTYTYELNNQKAPFNDVRVRTALKLALEQATIADKVLGNGELPAYTFTHPATSGGDFAHPEWVSWSQEKRNEEAKRLLSEAGFDSTNPLKFSLIYNTDEAHKKLAVAAAQIWKKNLGIEVKLENQEWKTFLDRRYSGDYEVARSGWCANYNEPSPFMNKLRNYATNKNNTSFYHNPTYDEILNDALRASDITERKALYQKAEALIDQDSVFVPVYHYVKTRLIKPYVGGYTGKEAVDSIRDKDLYIIEH